MSVGGTIIDIVKVTNRRWWINTVDPSASMSEPSGEAKGSVAVYVDPVGEYIQVGDTLWWQGSYCFWTPRQKPDGRSDVKIPKLSYSGVGHPERVREQHEP